MIQPDAKADSPNEVSASALAPDEQPLSPPPDEVGELEPGDLAWLAKLEHAFGGRWTHRKARIRRLVGAITQAASTLSRLRGERDEFRGWYEKVCAVASTHLTARLKAEDLNRKLVEVVKVVLSADREALADHRPKWGLADCVDNTGQPYQSQFLADALTEARSLLSISGGEAAGEDGG